MKNTNKNIQTGRSMIETMGYMVVSMFLIAGISKIVAGAYAEYKISQGSLQIADLAGTITKASAADANYGDIVKIINGEGTTELEKKERLRLIPRSFRVVDNLIYNTFGGRVEVAIPHDEIKTEHKSDQFAIRFYGLDHEQCVALMTKEWTSNRVVDLYAIVLNGENYWYWPIYKPNSASGEKPLPVKVIDVAGSGSGTSANGLCLDDNNIMWVFN